MTKRHSQPPGHAARLRVGLIGCGERGASNAASLGKTASALLTIVMDVEETLAENLGGRYGVPWTTDLEALLASRDLDAVLISSPNYLHASQAIQAVRAGKHVMVEKPVATSLGDAVAALAAARETGVCLSPFFSYRYLPEVQKARALIDAGALGDLFGVSLIFQHDKGPAYWHGGYTGRASSDWRMRREMSGGGVLIHSAIHFVDWLRYLTGREIVEVSAMAARLDSPGDVEDALTMWVRYDTGALGTINSVSCARGTEFLTEFRLWGRDGHLSLTPPFQFFSERLVDGKDPGQWHDFGRLSRIVHSVEYIERFARSMLREEDPEIPGEDGVAVQAIVEAAYQSVETGQPVAVKRAPWHLPVPV